MSEEMPSHTSSGAGLRPGTILLGAVVIILSAALCAYSFHEHRVATQLAAQNDQNAAALAATRGQIDALNAKLSSLEQQQTAKPSASRVAHTTSSKHAVHASRHSDDPRWKALQSQVNEQGKQIDATKQDLSSTRTELQGSIARTHDELVVLQKKGERAYFEFDVDKSSQFAHNGPMGVRLRKANVKHQYADLELMVDDYKVTKKHVNIFEPVVFYTAESQLPVELVINNISKDHIKGYVSEPKYKTSDLQAMSAGSDQNKTSRPKLELPSN